MFLRLIVFKMVFAFLVIGSGIGLAIRDGVSQDNPSAIASSFKRYPLPLGCGCAALAALAAFGDLLGAGRRKGALPTYTDEEFLAKFGGSKDAEPPLQ